MHVDRAALVLVERGSTPNMPGSIAQLDTDEEDYLSGHLNALRQRVEDQNALHARFQVDRTYLACCVD